MENNEVMEFVAGPVSAFMEDDKDDEDLLRIIKDLENVIQWSWVNPHDDDFLQMAVSATWFNIWGIVWIWGGLKLWYLHLVYLKWFVNGWYNSVEQCWHPVVLYTEHAEWG